MGNNQQAIRSSSWPGCLQSGQIPLVSNVLKLLKSEFNISTPMLGIEVIEQVRTTGFRASIWGMIQICSKANSCRHFDEIAVNTAMTKHHQLTSSRSPTNHRSSRQQTPVQVCRDRQNRLRRSKQGMLRCRKCKEAGKVRAWCKVCWGSQICRHGRQKRQCKDCGGSGLCVHG